MRPKVFVSHASEDKERFVTEFATRLRKNGVDAWLDKWEMLPGDSLIDKIFEEGLKEAQAVIIVLSENSIKKQWVQEELNVSAVNRISKGTKIIPIVLDGCNVPEVLNSTLWESISDTDSYDTSFTRILSSIFGVTDKPALGSVPEHVHSRYHEIGGLTKADNLILKESCEYAIKNNKMFVDPEKIFGDGSNLGFSRDEIKDCIEILESNGYLEVSRTLGGGDGKYHCNCKITTFGFDQYAKAYIANYLEVIEAIVSAIVNEKIHNNFDLSSKFNQPLTTVNFILDLLELNSHVKLSKMLGGRVEIFHIAASLRRALD